MANANLTKFINDINAIEDKRDTAEADLEADLTFLKETIDKLNATPGEWTPEEKALVDSLTARLTGSQERLQTLSDLTTPTPPEGGSGDGGQTETKTSRSHR